MQDFDDQNPRVRLLFGMVALLIVLGGLWLVSSLIWPEDNGQMVILKADATPYKVKPDDKGGMQIPHQDKLIFNTLSPDGKPVTVERILPGPEQPLYAQPLGSPQPASPAQVVKPVVDVPERADGVAAPAIAAPSVAAMGRVVETAPVKPLNQPVKPPAAFDMSKGEALLVKKPETPPAQPVSQSVKDVPPDAKDSSATVVEVRADDFSEAPKSKARLVEIRKAIEPQEDAEPASGTSKKQGEGGGRFQIASYFDRASADKAVAQFKLKYADVLDGTTLVIATATIHGDKPVFRVQGAASSAAVAGNLCSSIKAKGGTCVTLK